MKTEKLIAENATFIGFIQNGRGGAAIQVEDGQLYTVFNSDVNNLEIGAKGNLVYKSNVTMGFHKFEPNQ